MQHVGVLLPVQRHSDVPGLIEKEWPRINSDNHIASKGFVLIDPIKNRNDHLVIQSVQTGEFFVNTLLLAGDGSLIQDGMLDDNPPDEDEYIPPVGSPRYVFRYHEPRQLRVSTWQETLPSTLFPNEPILGVLPRDALFFNQLRFWQKLLPDNPKHRPLYSLYFELVAEQLCLAMAWLKFGERPDVPGHQAPANWTSIHHLELFPRNVFIHYQPRRPGRIPAAGIEANAFPQFVLGDFSSALLDGDDIRHLHPWYTDPNEDDRGPNMDVKPPPRWMDTYGFGFVLRYLCQAHLSHKDWMARGANTTRMANVNATTGWRRANILDLADPLNELAANPRWIVDTIYPVARARVAAYRNPPEGRPAGYFDGLDISWTRPRPRLLMPFVYNTDYAAAAEDVDGGEGDDHQGNNDRSERFRMSKLSYLHLWNDFKPRYELHTLEHNCPNLKPLSNRPPDADADGHGHG
ncbi:hypothetical protein N8I77_008948 [Diaporthe amygdali]|uniref:Uncharacterized protein n=1 Tax=Phomopsis amygdali TaxID=1214568 RepID=A0AAD9S8T1_PHOAM|nr:hypothetical protein N8I77_008948 [Diaporthe amygdali]